MKIAVLSGKGGTGKTFLSVNLACAAKQATYVDCDVEEPNGHLFLKPRILSENAISVLNPQIDMNLCTRCRICVEFCEYNALALAGEKVLVFNEICHSCGGCALLCPVGAITEFPRPIGKVAVGVSENVNVLTGWLNPGEVSGIPVIKDLLAKIENEIAVIDCPPGSACAVMESIRPADYCLLVAEPSLFGIHNLGMVHELVSLFEKPFGVVLNKCMPRDTLGDEYCEKHNIKVLARIPYDNELAQMNSKGQIAVREKEHHRVFFADLLSKITEEVAF